MSIIISIIIGFIVGLVARFLMPGRDAMGFILTTLLGIGGALVGRYIGLGLGMYKEDEPAGFFMSLLGALVLLFIYNLIARRNPNP